MELWDIKLRTELQTAMRNRDTVYHRALASAAIRAVATAGLPETRVQNFTVFSHCGARLLHRPFIEHERSARMHP